MKNHKDKITMPVSELGVTLQVSEKALRKIDRMTQERIRAARANKLNKWR